MFLLLKILSQVGDDHEELIKEYEEKQANNRDQRNCCQEKTEKRKLKEKVLKDFQEKEKK